MPLHWRSSLLGDVAPAAARNDTAARPDGKRLSRGQLTLAARWLDRISAPYLAGERPLTGLLIGANLGAFVVAVAAGAAGIIALGRAKSGAVMGVLVSITTIPAESNVGVGTPDRGGRGDRPPEPRPSVRSRFGASLVVGSGVEDSGPERRASMLNKLKAMWARLWRRDRQTTEHEFYDQHEASRYRSEAESRGSWNPPGGDSM